MYKGRITFPASLWAEAKTIGVARLAANKELMKACPRYSRGDKNEQVEILGVLGELIARHYLTRRNVDFTAAKLLDEAPVHMPDITVGDARLDVKASPGDRPYLLVNLEAHLKAKGVTHYWFLKLVSKTEALSFIFNYADVDKWPSKNFGYAEAKYISLTRALAA